MYMYFVVVDHYHGNGVLHIECFGYLDWLLGMFAGQSSAEPVSVCQFESLVQ